QSHGAVPGAQLPVGHSRTELATRLVQAVERGDLTPIRAVLAQGARVNDRDGNGNTAFGMALRVVQSSSVPLTPPDPRVLQLLLAHGADVNTKDEGGRPLLLNALSGH